MIAAAAAMIGEDTTEGFTRWPVTGSSGSLPWKLTLPVEAPCKATLEAAKERRCWVRGDRLCKDGRELVGRLAGGLDTLPVWDKFPPPPPPPPPPDPATPAFASPSSSSLELNIENQPAIRGPT